MVDELFPYYERELSFIRQSAREFARRFPAAAGRLMIEENRSADPHVERLIESFALIAGRIQHKLDDEFSELSNAMLGVLYPHYLAPVPSVAIVQLEAEASRLQLPAGFTLPRHGRFRSQSINDLACRFRSGYPVTLWPIQLTKAQVLATPLPAELKPPPKTVAALRLQFSCQGGLAFADLQLDRLRLFLNGGGPTVASLYELIFNHVSEVVARPLDQGPDAPILSFSPRDVLHQVGFDVEDGLLPYPPPSFQGYRLLTEFFAFPVKYHFLDLGGFQEIAGARFQKQVEIVLFFNRSFPTVVQNVTTDTFRLGCVPVINLFEQTAEPVPLTQSRFEYRITPDVAFPDGMEVYSITSVTGADLGAGATREYLPFYSFRHGAPAGEAYWFPTRRPSLRPNDSGTEVFLNLVDRKFDPCLPAESTLVIRTLCTNRQVPADLQQLGDRLRFEFEGVAPLSRVRCIQAPSRPLSPPHGRGAFWRLVAHLSLNHLSLTGGDQAADALKEILRLYDFTSSGGDGHGGSIARQMVEGILAVESQRGLGRIESESGIGLCRGTEITIRFDESKYVGTGLFLFASMLERFLGLYATLNSFTRLTARTSQPDTLLKRWPPRAGEWPLL